jgi:hypothetical protein
MQPHRERRAVMEYGSLGRTAQGHLEVDEKAESFIGLEI